MNFRGPARQAGFSTVELVGAVLLFSAATTGVLYMSKALQDHRAAAISANEQNAYATFQSQVALQGIDPSLVANPMAAALNQGGAGGPSAGQHLSAAFETGAVTRPDGAVRELAGSARVRAFNYASAAAGNQSTRGLGIGFAIETAGPPAPAAANAIQLAPPSFNVSGDLTHAAFPLNNVALLPSSNPPGTVYRYTTDGSAPTGSSPVWDNNPDWTPASFPGQVTLQAFNPDPQYAPSAAASATYSMALSLAFARADGRSSDLFGFTLADLGAPGATGVVLTDNLPGYVVLYTLDGSDPLISPTAVAYSSAFAPPQALFAPIVTLRAAAVSSDPRIGSSAVATYSLTADAVALTAPSFVTDNAQPLDPGTQVVISMNGGSGSPRTEINNGTPGTSSSSATSFPLN